MDTSPFDRIEDWAVAVIHHQTYLAPVFFLAIEEMGIPMPVPGDLVIAYTGYEVSKGAVSYPIAFFLILVAVLSGSTFLYFLSAKYGQFIILRLGRFIHLNETKLDQVEKKFRQYGVLVIIFGRHIPGFRIPITVFAGMSYIPYKKFIVSEFISVVFWIAIYLAVGERLGKKTLEVFKSNHHLYFFIAVPLILLVIIYILLWLKQKASEK